MINSLSSFILLLSIYFSTLCTCPPQRLSDLQKEEIKNSEYIFIGEVLEINHLEDFYTVKVIEPLDNRNNQGTIYTGKNWKSCSPYIDSKGKWLIYGNMEKDFFRVNLCGLSRSFKDPEEIFNSVPAPRPIKNENEAEKKIRWKKWKKLNNQKSKEDLHKEISVLRERSE